MKKFKEYIKVIKKASKFIYVFICIGAILVLLGFVNESRKEILCTNVSIIIEPHTDFFIDVDDVQQLLNNHHNELLGRSMLSIDMAKIEIDLEKNRFVQNAEVFYDLSGKLNLKINQVMPILRIIGGAQSYYIDENGLRLPLSGKYTPRVLVATTDVKDLESRKSLFQGLYQMAMYINKNDFWNAQIQQIHINKNYEFELIPRVGHHRILFGEQGQIIEKFENLMIFYKKGLNKIGWKDYKTISLKYKDQIVCTRFF